MRIRHANNGSLKYIRVRVKDIFHLCGIDVFTAGYDHVLFSINNIDIPFTVNYGHIPCIEPAIQDGLFRFFWKIPISGSYDVSLNNDFTYLFIVFSYLIALIVHDLKIHIYEFSSCTSLVSQSLFP